MIRWEIGQVFGVITIIAGIFALFDDEPFGFVLLLGFAVLVIASVGNRQQAKKLTEAWQKDKAEWLAAKSREGGS